MTAPGSFAISPIQIVDDDTTASDTDGALSASGVGPSLKRKLTDGPVEQDRWSDESDGAFERLKKRKRRSMGKGKKKADGKGKKGQGKSRAANLKDWIKDVDESSAQDDDLLLHDIPAYVRERRKKFDENRAILKESGLRLPPDYADIYFSDDENMARLQERPRFGDSIKPSRPYKDVELEYSAGVIPASIAQYLRDYQIVGVKFLHQLFVYQKGGILGDDMGLGKTVQVVAFLTAAFGKTADERDEKRMRKMRRATGSDNWYPRVLIICPGSVIENWKLELNRWGWWHIGTYHGTGKDDVLQTAKSGRLEIMITTYQTYKLGREKINNIQWDAVVADECHFLKERISETTKAMNEVNALCRIGLTGTAIQNKYEELWTLLDWTNPGHFGTASEWKQAISIPLALGQSHDATLYQLSRARRTAKKLVQNLLPQFFLRRMKSLIAHQLPKKTDKVVFCPLTDIQREAYENFLDSEQVKFVKGVSEPCPCGSGKKKGWCCYTRLENGKHWNTLVFPTITSLKNLSSHLTLLIPSGNGPADKQAGELKRLKTCLPDRWEELYKRRDSMVNLSNPDFCGKWKILNKLLRFWNASGDKVLVFSHSVRLLRILQYLFNSTSYNVSYLDGSLSYEDRQKAVDNFNTDSSQFVFLISTKAGGVGLNITSANKVVIFDPHWNPSYDMQAQDRAYRIGQVRDVDVFRLISAGTIEEIIYARQIYKQQQANIGYNASTERRYFKGVQQDSERKGEIFGIDNLLSFQADQVLLRDIVNKTNIAEAKAGVNLSDINLENVIKDENDELNLIKKEEDDGEGGLSQFAEFLTNENQEEVLKAKLAARPKSDAIQAILASAGVEYTHENSEVVGSSKVEAQLSRRAELAADDENEDNIEGHSALFADSQANTVPMSTSGRGFRLFYNPPRDVMRRQFCSMAKEFGFPNATAFALVVESWSQEQRRNCLDTFYKIRETKLGMDEVKKDEDEDEKKPLDVMMDDEKTEDDLIEETKLEDVKDEPAEDPSLPSLAMANPSVGKVAAGEQSATRHELYDDDEETDDEL